MNKAHRVDNLGYLIETQLLPPGIEILGSINTELPETPLDPGKAWRWMEGEWIQDEKPRFVEATNYKKYSQAEWIRKNGFTGYKILSAAKADPLAQYFHEVLKAEELVSTADARLAIAYGYYVGAGYITQAEADSICEFSVNALTTEQVQQLMEVSGE